MLGVAQPVGEAARVENGLRGAVRADRIHRVRGVAEQRDAAMRPARQRIAVAHRVFPELRRRLDQRLARRRKGMRKRCTCGIRSSKRPGRDQSSLRGGTPPSPTFDQHRPVGQRAVGAARLRRSDRSRAWPPSRRRSPSSGRSGTAASRWRRATASSRSSAAALHWGRAFRAPPNGCRRRRPGCRRARCARCEPSRSKK